MSICLGLVPHVWRLCDDGRGANRRIGNCEGNCILPRGGSWRNSYRYHLGFFDWLRHEIHQPCSCYRAHFHFRHGIPVLSLCRDFPHVWNFGVSKVKEIINKWWASYAAACFCMFYMLYKTNWQLILVFQTVTLRLIYFFDKKRDFRSVSEGIKYNIFLENGCYTWIITLKV